MRPARESDLPELAELFPDDVELNPAFSALAGLEGAEGRTQLLMQGYWKSWGLWSVDSWNLGFLVAHRGRTVGVQSLEGEHFPELRIVDSASWLAENARGAGIGKFMRTAVLALAFDHLGAQAAVSSAREDNAASLGVSRRLGYGDNGVSRSRSPTGPCTLVHLLLPREDWVASGRGSLVSVAGLDRCAPYFGVDLGPLPG